MFQRIILSLMLVGASLAVMAQAPTVTSIIGGGSFCNGDVDTLEVMATGATPLSYQWQMNGVDLPGDTFNILVFSSISTADTGDYRCVVTNGSGSDTSGIVSIAVNPTVVPTVSVNALTGDTICIGDTACYAPNFTFGGATPNFTWLINGFPVSTDSVFKTNAVNSGDIVIVAMGSSMPCPNPDTVVSSFFIQRIIGGVVPTVSINGSVDSICPGDTVIFTASTTNGGSSPDYSWRINGAEVDTMASFTAAGLNNGDWISCVMTSSLQCALPDTAVSNNDTIEVVSTVNASVSISSNMGNSVCTGATVVFTPAPTNGGSSPQYDWYINGVYVSTGATYSTSSLSNNDTVDCRMISNAFCVAQDSVWSNEIIMTVGTIVPTISIQASPGDTICSGDSITFTATLSGGGTSPFYNWRVNGFTMSNDSVFGTTTLIDQDVITCEMTSSEVCAVPSMVTSNAITVTVNSNLIPTINITVYNDTLVDSTACAGETLMFVSGITNGGDTPMYVWRVNSAPVSSSDTFFTSTLNDGDVVECELTSNAACLAVSMAASNQIRVTINPNVTPTLSINVTPSDTVCFGDSVTFNSMLTNGGNNPDWTWYKNGIVQLGDSFYATAFISPGDSVALQVISSARCATIDTLVSNSIIMTSLLKTNPILLVNPNPTANVCEGDSVLFVAVAVNGGANPSFRWSFNGAITFGSDSFVLAPDTSGILTCLLTSSRACVNVDTVLSSPITVNTIPEPVVTLTPDSFRIDGNIGFFAYQWLKNGDTVSGAINSFVFPDTTAIYQLAVRDGNGCLGLSDTLTFIFPDTMQPVDTTDIALLENFTEVKVYPNPGNGFYSVESNSSSAFTIRVYNLEGRIVYAARDIREKSTIDITNQPDGIYFIQIETDANSGVLRVIKE